MSDGMGQRRADEDEADCARGLPRVASVHVQHSLWRLSKDTRYRSSLRCHLCYACGGMWVSPDRSSRASVNDDPGPWIKCTDYARSYLCSIEENVQVPVEIRGGRCRAALCTSGRGSGAFPALYRKAICTKRDSVGFISINTVAFVSTSPCGARRVSHSHI